MRDLMSGFISKWRSCNNTSALIDRQKNTQSKYKNEWGTGGGRAGGRRCCSTDDKAEKVVDFSCFQLLYLQERHMQIYSTI
jgi:hypothetical protein